MTTEELAVKVTDVDARCKSNTHRINALAGQIDAVNRLAIAIEVMATEQKHQTGAIQEVKNDLAALDAKVETIEQKPAKRWDGLVEKIIFGLVGAFVTALAAGIIYLVGAAP